MSLVSGVLILFSAGTSNSFGIWLGCGPSGGGGGGGPTSSSSDNVGGGAFIITFGFPSLVALGGGGDLKVGILTSPPLITGHAIGASFTLIFASSSFLVLFVEGFPLALVERLRFVELSNFLMLLPGWL